MRRQRRHTTARRVCRTAKPATGCTPFSTLSALGGKKKNKQKKKKKNKTKTKKKKKKKHKKKKTGPGHWTLHFHLFPRPWVHCCFSPLLLPHSPRGAGCSGWSVLVFLGQCSFAL